MTEESWLDGIGGLDDDILCYVAALGWEDKSEQWRTNRVMT